MPVEMICAQAICDDMQLRRQAGRDGARRNVQMGDQGIFPPTSTGPGPTVPSGGDEFGGQAIGTPPVAPPPVMPDMGIAPEPEKKGGGLRGKLFAKPVVAVLCLLIGAGGMFAAVHFGLLTIGAGRAGLGTPQVMVGNAELKRQIEGLQGRIAQYTQAVGTEEEAQAAAAELAERRQSEGDIATVRQVVADMVEKQEKYDELEMYIEEINDAITTANVELNSTRSKVDIYTARREGLRGEVARFEGLVGKLEAANDRRVAVKDTLEESLTLFIVGLKESAPLVPPEFEKGKRIGRAQALQNKLAQTNWAYPALIQEFTDLFVDEIKLNSAQHYFIAKLPIEVKGVQTERWCECLALGTWAVYFQTIDRRIVGVFMNTAEVGRPTYEFITELASVEKAQIRAEIERVRPEDFEERVAMLPGAPQRVIKQKDGVARFFDLL